METVRLGLIYQPLRLVRTLICLGPHNLRPGFIFMGVASPWMQGMAGGATLDPLRVDYARYLGCKVQEAVRPLSRMLYRWKSLVSDVSVVDQIARGHQILFKDGLPPPFNGVLHTSPPNAAQAQVLDAELEQMLSKGAVELVPAHQRECGYYSRYFLVPKKGGDFRPILNLKPFNKYVEKVQFKMLRTPTLLSMVKQADWLSSIDLKDAFFHCPVVDGHRKYLRFCYRGQCYQFTCLPFGYRLSPLTFTRCVKAALGVLMRKGMRLAWFLDDLLVLARSQEQAMCHTLELIEFMAYMGFTINWKKSAPWPARQATYLGLRLDTESMVATLTQERWGSTRLALARCVPGTSCVTGRRRGSWGSCLRRIRWFRWDCCL